MLPWDHSGSNGCTCTPVDMKMFENKLCINDTNSFPYPTYPSGMVVVCYITVGY